MATAPAKALLTAMAKNNGSIVVFYVLPPSKFTLKVVLV